MTLNSKYDEKSKGKKTLYVCRRLLNSDEFINWAKEQGFSQTLEPNDFHVTIAFSRKLVDWSLLTPVKSRLLILDGKREVIPLGDKGAVVLKFGSKRLHERWAEILEAGASWDYPEYQSHVTITYDGSSVDLTNIKPFMGPLHFGPELFDEVTENWDEKITEVKSSEESELDEEPSNIIKNICLSLKGLNCSLKGDNILVKDIDYGKLIKYFVEKDWEIIQCAPSKEDKITDIKKDDITISIEQKLEGEPNSPILIYLSSNDEFDEMMRPEFDDSEAILKMHRKPINQVNLEKAFVSSYSFTRFINSLNKKLIDREHKKLRSNINDIINEIEDTIDDQSQRIEHEIKILDKEISKHVSKLNSLRKKAIAIDPEIAEYFNQLDQHLVSYVQNILIKSARSIKSINENIKRR